MRGFRNLHILTAVSSLVFGLGSVGWAQDNSGQNTGSNPTPQVTKPSKAQPVGRDGADSAGPFQSQGTGVPGLASQTQQPTSPDGGVSDLPGTRLEQDQAKMRNLDRQKKLVDDTVKLVNLANELKAEVDKSSKDMMSVDVIRKADEIEKLARSVKEKMKGS